MGSGDYSLTDSDKWAVELDYDEFEDGNTYFLRLRSHQSKRRSRSPEWSRERHASREQPGRGDDNYRRRRSPSDERRHRQDRTHSPSKGDWSQLRTSDTPRAWDSRSGTSRNVGDIFNNRPSMTVSKASTRSNYPEPTRAGSTGRGRSSFSRGSGQLGSDFPSAFDGRGTGTPKSLTLLPSRQPVGNRSGFNPPTGPRR